MSAEDAKEPRQKQRRCVIIGEANETVMAHAIVNLVEHEANTHRTTAELSATARRVCTRLKYKVSVAELPTP